ncbi:hypothetical protein ABEB36_004307 [Hypothenemus hampei]|uniref:Uncharacterized protein n=1 Tax=Hypothenemus hampei TaxID=57062 RepID=A0ABD1F2Y1_HYPHA
MKYSTTAKKPINVPRDPGAVANNFDSIWTNWQDIDIQTIKLHYRNLSRFCVGLISGACVAIIIIEDMEEGSPDQKNSRYLKPMFIQKTLFSRKCHIDPLSTHVFNYYNFVNFNMPQV